METYTILADVDGGELQNVQEWAATWGEIEAEMERLDGELLDAAAVLGDHDFQFTYRAADAEAAMRIAVVVERYGLDTRTHRVIDVERLGELVEDL